MESIRQQLLNAELKRIEEEAEARSVAIMNKADALASAHQLCTLLNTGCESSAPFKVSVSYNFIQEGAVIFVYTHEDGARFMRLLSEHNIAWTDAGDWGGDYRNLRLADYPGVNVIVDNDVMAAVHMSLVEAA